MESNQPETMDKVHTVVDKIFKNTFSIGDIVGWAVADLRSICEILNIQKDGTKKQLLDEIAKTVFSRSLTANLNDKVMELLQKTASSGTPSPSYTASSNSSEKSQRENTPNKEDNNSFKGQVQDLTEEEEDGGEEKEEKDEELVGNHYDISEIIRKTLPKDLWNAYLTKEEKNAILRHYPIPNGIDFSVPSQPDFLFKRMNKGYKKIDRDLRDTHRKTMEVTRGMLYALHSLRTKGEKCSVDEIEDIIGDMIKLSLNATASLSRVRKSIGSKSAAGFLGSAVKEPTSSLFNESDFQQMERVIKIEESMNRAERIGKNKRGREERTNRFFRKEDRSNRFKKKRRFPPPDPKFPKP
jgi:hypothetical protein